MTRPGKLAVSDRLEHLYLALLRVLTLVIATVCICAFAYFAADSVRRALTQTEVKPHPVAVTAEDALGSAIKSDATGKDGAEGNPDNVSESVRKTHAEFMNGAFERYYQQYRQLAVSYKKSDDTLLTKPQLAEELGYTTEALAVGNSSQLSSSDPADEAANAMLASYVRTAEQFQTDKGYAEAQIAAVSKALTDNRLMTKARGYKAAEKTAEACHTEYQLRVVFDPRSMACSDWYEDPMGCDVRRAVPVQRCEAAYPAGIKSPLKLFSDLDKGYRLAWSSKKDAADEAAASERAAKESVKAGATGSLMLALQVGGAFSVVMFLFLLIAVERHLRRISQQREATA